MVWDSEYPWDVRVEKMCRSMVRAGHQVHLLCRNRRWEPTLEKDGEFWIHRLRLMPAMVSGVLTFPAFFNPVWLTAISRVVREQDCDLILVRDLPLALAGILVGRITGRPVIFDFAENYPAMLRDFWPANRRRLFNWIVRSPRIARWVEKVAIRLADHILVVVEESKERLQRLGVEAERLSVVMNTPLPDRFMVAGEKSPEAEASNPYFDVIYLGFLELARGVETAIQAMPAIAAKIPHARLIVIGSGSQEKYLHDLARRMKIADRVVFKGWIPYDRAHDWIVASSVGIVPHVATESWMTTIPNKLFDYMALGKPVVVSDVRPAKRIVEQEKSGLVFRSQDAEDFSLQVQRLADPVLRRFLGGNGRRAVVERYQWSFSEKILLDALERSLGTGQRVAHQGRLRGLDRGR